MIILNINKLTKHFGALAAVQDFSCNVNKGECHALIGPNGAGKTTMFNMIAGLFEPTTGEIIFNGENIAGLKPHVIAKKGIARTFQVHALFNSMSVLDNMVSAFFLKSSSRFLDMLLHTPHARAEDKRILQKSMEALDAMGLSDIREMPAKGLGHVARGKLGLAMALATEPQLLLLDEPVSGMTERETEEILNLIRRIINNGITVILVEHNMKAVTAIADRITVLNFGSKIAEGSPDEIKSNKEVIKAYLGE